MRPWEMNIHRVVPYVPGDQPAGDKPIRLDTNESPYPSVSGTGRALKEMDVDRLRRYPGSSSAEFVKVPAEYYGVGEDQAFVGVGSDDVITISLLTFFGSQKPMLFPDITYSSYKVWADLYRTSYETPALDGNMVVRPLDYKGENGGIIFPNPNAPTDVYIPLDQIGEIIKANQDVTVIVDEAYIDFAGPSARELLSGYGNLLVIQTFNKPRSMAGMCIDLTLESPASIKALNDVKHFCSSYTTNLPPQFAGTQTVEGRAYFEGAGAKIVDTRERAKKRFAELGFIFSNPTTNSVLVTHERVPARAIFNTLKKEWIYARYFSAPRLDNSPRASIRTDEEMDALSRFLE